MGDGLWGAQLYSVLVADGQQRWHEVSPLFTPVTLPPQPLTSPTPPTPPHPPTAPSPRRPPHPVHIRRRILGAIQLHHPIDGWEIQTTRRDVRRK